MAHLLSFYGLFILEVQYNKNQWSSLLLYSQKGNPAMEGYFSYPNCGWMVMEIL